MTKRLYHIFMLLLCCAVFLQGCAAVSSMQDERLYDTQISDKAISTIVKNNLVRNDMGSGWDLAVYSFYGNVFLAGECKQTLRDRAIDIAKSDKRVKSITTHWFEHAKAEESDFIVSSRVRTALINAKGLTSSRVEAETNAGRVALFGVVSGETEKQAAIDAVTAVKGVKEVTSYLMIAPRNGEVATVPMGERFPGRYTAPIEPGYIDANGQPTYNYPNGGQHSYGTASQATTEYGAPAPQYGGASRGSSDGGVTGIPLP